MDARWLELEVTERATGERSTRPIEDVEALIRGEGLPATA